MRETKIVEMEKGSNAADAVKKAFQVNTVLHRLQSEDEEGKGNAQEGR